MRNSLKILGIATILLSSINSFAAYIHKQYNINSQPTKNILPTNIQPKLDIKTLLGITSVNNIFPNIEQQSPEKILQDEIAALANDNLDIKTAIKYEALLFQSGNCGAFMYDFLFNTRTFEDENTTYSTWLSDAINDPHKFNIFTANCKDFLEKATPKLDSAKIVINNKSDPALYCFFDYKNSLDSPNYQLYDTYFGSNYRKANPDYQNIPQFINNKDKYNNFIQQFSYYLSLNKSWGNRIKAFSQNPKTC